MTRIMISLNDHEKLALRALAERECRDPRAQAALIIRHKLQRLGLLVIEHPGDCSLVTSTSVDNPKEEGSHVIG